MNHSFAFLPLLALLLSAPASGTVVLAFDPISESRSPGASFSVDVLADADLLLLGFGFDVDFDPSVLSLVGVSFPGPWTTVFAPDGDGLAALGPVAGMSGVGLTLATLTFEALAVGTTALGVSVTPGDLTEGFSLKGGGFDAFETTPGEVTVPEPAGVWLLATAMTTVAALRWRVL